MKHEPLVSILTPCLNRARYVESCIQSVLAQNYSNVEHVIQDGGSTDGTVDIFKRYSDQVKWSSGPDQGQSDGLNKALQRSKGDLILVLNADDELLPYACSWGVEQMQRYPEVAVVYGDEYWMDEKGKILEKSLGPNPYNFKRVFCAEDTIPAQAAFVRRSALESVGCFIDTSRPTCPDFELWVRLGMVHQMKYVPAVISSYRKHSGAEGSQLEVIKQMVVSKREVIDSVTTLSATPPWVKQLKREAHSGVVTWGALALLQNRFFKSAFSLYTKGALLCAPWEKLLFPAHFLHFSLRALKRFVRSWFQDFRARYQSQVG
jgi:hypothetical protein